jgi:hypothetical protein
MGTADDASPLRDWLIEDVAEFKYLYAVGVEVDEMGRGCWTSRFAEFHGAAACRVPVWRQKWHSDAVRGGAKAFMLGYVDGLSLPVATSKVDMESLRSGRQRRPGLGSDDAHSSWAVACSARHFPVLFSQFTTSLP